MLINFYSLKPSYKYLNAHHIKFAFSEAYFSYYTKHKYKFLRDFVVFGDFNSADTTE